MDNQNAQIEQLVRSHLGIGHDEPVDAENFLDYARDVGLVRFAEAEYQILRDRDVAYRYCRDVLKNRWPEFELLFVGERSSFNEGDLYSAFEYIRDVVRGPWVEMEAYLLSDPYYAVIYPAFLRWNDDCDRGELSFFVEPERHSFLLKLATCDSSTTSNNL